MEVAVAIESLTAVDDPQPATGLSLVENDE